jgi:phytoene synthase
LPRALLNALIDAHEADLIEAPFDTWAQFDAYADATAGNVIRLAANILGAADRLDTVARHAGIAYALTGLLRALPFHAAKRRLMLPLQALRQTGISQEQIFSGTMDAKITALIALAAARAREHFNAARKATTTRDHLQALLPVSLVPLYLKRLTRGGFNPYRDPIEIPVYRRQLAMLAAMIRGSL